MKTYAFVYGGVVQQIIPPIERVEEDRPPAPPELPDNPSDADIAEHDRLQALHDDYQVGEIPIEERFTAEFVAQCVDITGLDPQPVEGWVYSNGSFSPYVAPPRTPAEILATNTATRNSLLAAAALAIAPLQDAVDLGEATDEETQMLTKWKQFRVAVNRVDLTQDTPAWPTAPQPGYGAALAPVASDS